MWSQKLPADGIHAMVSVRKMTKSARKLRDFLARKPGAPLFRKEFGYYCLDEWHAQGLDRDADFAKVFHYDPPGHCALSGLGWTEAAFVPQFEDRILEDRGDYELIQDCAGRHVLFFKGRRNGFMPEYVDHPVKDMKTWDRDVKWRLSTLTPQRYSALEGRLVPAIEAAGQGLVVEQQIIGGYMYLRSLIGPAELPCAFYDMPDVIHDCMKTWLELSDAVTEHHQRYVTFDAIYLAEDICYNHGSLISPEMMKEFLFPYYQQLLSNVKSRQLDPARHLYFHLDTDGWCVPVIELYRDAVGMDVMSPFEVASGCDVVEIGRRYPELAISGGIDKRVLAKGREAIDRHVEHILPAMRRRGGFLPTCDHGVPAEVSLENYLHYRKRCVELSG